MTEFGRRGALAAGAAALAATVVFGILMDGDPVYVVLQGVLAAVIFGAGGLLIGNLLQGYILAAARREVVDAAVRKKMKSASANSRKKDDFEDIDIDDIGEGI